MISESPGFRGFVVSEGLGCKLGGLGEAVGCPMEGVSKQPPLPGPHMLGEEQPSQASRRRHLERDHHWGHVCGTTPGPQRGRKNKMWGEGIREAQQEGAAA